MSYLALDIGTGTQDALIYSKGDHLENSVKLIFPAPTRLFAKYIENSHHDLFIAGSPMGGGPVSKALKEHLSRGYNVFITKNASLTIKDDLDKVSTLGFDIVEQMENPHLCLNDLDMDFFEGLRKRALYPDFEKILVAVQDHGFVKNQSDRVTRINFFKDFLHGDLKNACFKETSIIPEGFNRFKTIKNTLEQFGYSKFNITDTGIAAALGALHNVSERPVITVDVGNGHTFAALIHEGYKVHSFFEHHTKMSTPEKIWGFIRKMLTSTITFEDVFNDGGHGAHCFQKDTFPELPVYVTGPQRCKLFNDLAGNVHFASPAGDTMITGPVGLLMQERLI